MKAIIIGILIAIAILDVLLFLGCFELEKLIEEERRADHEAN